MDPNITVVLTKRRHRIQAHRENIRWKWRQRSGWWRERKEHQRLAANPQRLAKRPGPVPLLSPTALRRNNFLSSDFWSPERWDNERLVNTVCMPEGHHRSSILAHRWDRLSPCAKDRKDFWDSVSHYGTLPWAWFSEPESGALLPVLVKTLGTESHKVSAVS